MTTYGRLEQQGDRLGRRRASAVGARGRGLVLAATGDLPAAMAAFEDALRAAEDWDVPFYRKLGVRSRTEMARKLTESG